MYWFGERAFFSAFAITRMTFYEYPSTPVESTWISFHPNYVTYLEEYSPLGTPLYIFQSMKHGNSIKIEEHYSKLIFIKKDKVGFNHLWILKHVRCYLSFSCPSSDTLGLLNRNPLYHVEGNTEALMYIFLQKVQWYFLISLFSSKRLMINKLLWARAAESPDRGGDLQRQV